MKVKELFEIKQSPEKLKTLQYIKQWRIEFKRQHRVFGKFTLEDDGSINHLSKELIIENFMLDEDGFLLVKFNECNKINCWASKLKGFKNFPTKVLNKEKNNFMSPIHLLGVSAEQSKKITSLEGFPQYVSGIVDFSMFPNISISHINNYIKSAYKIVFYDDYVGPLLSLLKINNLQKLSIHNDYNERLKTAIRIINNHLQDKDILACQDELIENGLKEYAKL